MEEKSIIEKLGIIPIRAVPMFKGQSDCDICKAEEVREKEVIFNDMLEALIEDAIACEKSILESDFFTNDKVKKVLEERLDIIEKACHPKSWEEIKELIK